MIELRRRWNGRARAAACALLLAAAIAACGGGRDDGGGALDATADAVADANANPAVDGASSASPPDDDAAFDAEPDAPSKTTLDAAEDVAPDSSDDASVPFDAPCATVFIDSLPDAAPLAEITDAGLAGTLFIAANDGGGLYPAGFTDDDYFIYGLDGPEWYAKPLDGGPPQTIISAPDGGTFVSVAVSGLDVFVQSPSGDSYAWRSGGGAALRWQSQSDLADGYVVAVSADGSRAVVSDRTTGNAVSVHGIDLTARTSTLLFNACSDPLVCNCVEPTLGAFVGGTAVLNACLSETSTFTQIASFAGASWTKTPYVQLASALAVVPTTAGFFASPNSLELSLYSLTGGASIPVDEDVAKDALTPDGSALLYVTEDGLLKRATVASPQSPTPLACGISDFAADNPLTISPDGKYVAVLANGAFWLASTTTADSRPVTNGSFVGFSADSSKAFFTNGGAGFWSQPVGGGTPTLLVLDDGSPFQALSAGKVLFGVAAQSELYEWDSAGTAPPIPFTRVPGSFFEVSRSRKFVAYTTDPGGTALDLAAIP